MNALTVAFTSSQLSWIDGAFSLRITRIANLELFFTSGIFSFSYWSSTDYGTISSVILLISWFQAGTII
jgi:hypothetical protein